jgi:thymidylate synthase (FAD)
MKIDLLDHGYVQLIESWGSDERIIEAARMSTNKGFQGWGRDAYVGKCEKCTIDVQFSTAYLQRNHGCIPLVIPCVTTNCDHAIELKKEVGDERLLSYLWNNKHATPFEMAGIVIEVQAPIFVFREWHRHRTQSYNELSARYTPLPDVNYVPTIDRLMINAGGSNKQAGTVAESEALTAARALEFQGACRAHYRDAEEDYQAFLSAGVPKELARIILPVGRYSRMRASANLRNWLAFLTLRLAPNAQWEIRQYANAVSDMIANVFPRTWHLFSKEAA